MNQNAAILKHLKRHRTITTLEAVEHIGCLRLSERIRELKKDGHKIGGHMVEVRSRHGMARVKRYYLCK